MKVTKTEEQIHAAFQKLGRQFLIKSEGCEDDRIWKQYTHVLWSQALVLTTANCIPPHGEHGNLAECQFCSTQDGMFWT